MARRKGLFDKLARAPEEIRLENLRTWASTIEGAIPIDEVRTRQAFCAAGVIQNIRIDPREGRGSIEATIIDGSGEMVVKWLGRPSVSGIKLGMGLVVQGTCGAGSDRELVVLNPEYRLVPGPEHG